MRRRAAVVAVPLALAVLALSAPARSVEAPRWSTLPSSTLARQEVVAARVGDAVYVAGGFADTDPTTVVERLDLRSGRWDRVAALPFALNHHAVATHGGSVYLVDGFIGDPGGLLHSLGPVTAVLLRYDPAADRWTELPPPPTRRAAAGAAAIGGRLYVAGGVSPDGGELGLLEVYDLDTGRWSRGGDMAQPREHVAAVALEGHLFVIGGRLDPAAATGAVATVERYDPAAGIWERVDDLNHPRSAAGAAVVAGSIVVFGGEDAAGIVSSAERFDPATGSWTLLPDMGVPRAALGAVAHGSRALAIEGTPAPRVGSSDTVEALELPRPELRLKVSPARVRAGGRTSLRVRVTRMAAGRPVPVPGARVRVGGLRASTDSAGVATVIPRFRHAARRRVTATRAGHVPARASVLVLPGGPKR